MSWEHPLAWRFRTLREGRSVCLRRGGVREKSTVKWESTIRLGEIVIVRTKLQMGSNSRTELGGHKMTLNLNSSHQAEERNEGRGLSISSHSVLSPLLPPLLPPLLFISMLLHHQAEGGLNIH